MDTQHTFVERRHARGAVRPVTVAIIAILAAIAAAAWLLIIRPYQTQRLVDQGGAPTLPSNAGKAKAADAGADLQAMDVDQLLAEASKALKAQRLVAPAGINAVELYLRVLAKQPGNPVATSALRETFPYAATATEQAINAGNFDEAQREIGLLAKADPTNFTLTILRSKLDAQRKLASQQQHAQDAQKAAQLAAQKAAADKAVADATAAKQAEQQRLAAEQAKPKAPAAAPAAAAPAPAAVETSDAVLTRRVNAIYPSAALRAGTSGWVIVAFTVTPEGRTSDVRVVSSQPRHVFDRAAMDAVGRYQFKPAMRAGVAVASNQQQRIDFSNSR